MKQIGIFMDFSRKKSEYEKRGMPVPESVLHVYETKMRIADMINILDWAARNQAITKECQRLFKKIDDETIYPDIPEAVREHYRKCVREVVQLRDEINAYKEEYLGNGYNLTRKGRNRVREAWNAMRHFQGKQVYW